MAASTERRSDRVAAGVTAAAVLAAAAWAYAPTVLGLVTLWRADPNYSQGFIIPLLAAGLLVLRFRESSPAAAPAPRTALVLLTAAVLLRAASAYFYVTPLDHLSLLAVLAGVCLLFGGYPWLRRAWPALALLVFMFPIPAAVGGNNVIAGLQAVATRASTFALQTLGVVVVRDGNVMLTKEGELGVVEACSGLRMLMVFCALSVVTAVLIPGGWVRKALLVGSAVPLALCCNVVRITAAGLARESMGGEAGHFVFHDLAGWLMMPLAFLLLGVEVYVLSKLFRAVETPAPARPTEPAAPAPAVVGPGPVVAVG